MSPNPIYDPEDLREFLQGATDIDIVFYGGEPLLNTSFLMAVMDTIPEAKFTVWTSGLLLHKLPTPYLLRLSSILISIDGRECVHDGYRGAGTYAKVVQNIQDARARGFTGDIVARMCCSIDTNIYLDARSVLSIPGVTAVNWQLDALWDIPMGERWDNEIRKREKASGRMANLQSFSSQPNGSIGDVEDLSGGSHVTFGGAPLEKSLTYDGREEGFAFKQWARDNYIPNLKKLIEWWLDEAQKGLVHNIVPITRLMGEFLVYRATPYDSKFPLSGPWCGAGETSLNITTDGDILACYAGEEEEWNKVGTIADHNWKTAFGVVTASSVLKMDPCASCDIKAYCGSRCLYAQMTRYWEGECLDLVCESVKTLINTVKESVDIVERLIDIGTISIENFSKKWETIGCEITP